MIRMIITIYIGRSTVELQPSRIQMQEKNFDRSMATRHWRGTIHHAPHIVAGK